MLAPGIDPAFENVILGALSPSARRPAGVGGGVCRRSSWRRAGGARAARRHRHGGRAIVLDPRVVDFASPASSGSLPRSLRSLAPRGSGRPDELRHHRPGRLRQHHQRAAVRRRAQSRPDDRPRAVAVPQGLSRQPRPGNPAPDGASAGFADHPRGGARDRGARATSRRRFPARSPAWAATTCWRSKPPTPRTATSWRASRSRPAARKRC